MADWYLMNDDPYLGVRRWGLDMDDMTIVRTEYYAVDPFMEANKRQLNESIGQRFGEFRHVASTPLHLWAEHIAPRRKEGDDKSVKKWLNDDANRPYRTFHGKI